MHEMLHTEKFVGRNGYEAILLKGCKTRIVKLSVPMRSCFYIIKYGRLLLLLYFCSNSKNIGFIYESVP